jgi:hypothetical protein
VVNMLNDWLNGGLSKRLFKPEQRRARR